MLHFSPKKYKTIVSKTNRPEGNFVAHFSEKKKRGGNVLSIQRITIQCEKDQQPR